MEVYINPPSMKVMVGTGKINQASFRNSKIGEY